MPMFQARKLCPDAIILPPNMAKYQKAGKEVRALMLELTPLVEPLSIDEAFLDLTGTETLHKGSAGGKPRAPGAEDRAGDRHHGVDRPQPQQIPGQDRLRPQQAARLLGDRQGGDHLVPRRQAGALRVGHRPEDQRQPGQGRADHAGADPIDGGARPRRALRQAGRASVAPGARPGCAHRRSRGRDQERVGGNHVRYRHRRFRGAEARAVAIVREGVRAAEARRPCRRQRASQAQDRRASASSRARCR